MKVPGEFWLLYSVRIQSAPRFVLEIRTSSMSPLKDCMPLNEPIQPPGLAEVAGEADLGPATREPFL